MRRLLASALAALALAGCIQAAPGAHAPDAPALLRGATPLAPAPGSATFASPVVLGVAASGAEPDLVLGPAGVAYDVSPVQGQLYRSDDAGATWTGVGRVGCSIVSVSGACPLGYQNSTTLDGQGDASVAVLPDGDVAWLGLGGSSGAIPFQLSTNQGVTFRAPVDVSGAPTHSYDRQWIVAGPDGALYAAFRDLTTSQDVVRVSRDEGATWGPRIDASPDGQMGEPALDPPRGILYLPVYDDARGVMTIARSLDGGATWSVSTVPDVARAPLAYFWPAVSVDAAGNVYAVWARNANPILPSSVPLAAIPDGNYGTGAIYFSASRDHGVTWSPAARVSPAGHAAVLPWIAAGGPGRVVVAYYESALGAPNGRVPDQWNVVVQESFDADGATPTFTESAVTPSPVHVGAICVEGSLCSETGGDRTRLDFLTVRVLADGQPIVTWAQDDLPMENVVIEVARGEGGPSLR